MKDKDFLFCKLNTIIAHETGPGRAINIPYKERKRHIICYARDE